MPDDMFSHLDDPAEREWLRNVPSIEVARNAHRIYDYMRENGIPADSYTRELAFTKAAQGLGVAYDILYDAWLDTRPISEFSASLPSHYCAPGAHSWVAGMMYVNDEDVESVAAVRNVKCETCEKTFVPGDQYGEE